MFTFIHSGDLHLGKRFGNLPEELRGRLREARHGAIDRLAAAAREAGASTVLLAGDTFDTETPTPDIRRQALAAMGHHAPLRWVILPGNHDSLQAEPLWAALRAEASPNVVLAVDAAPLLLAPGIVLLPSPCTTRRPGRDLTAWTEAAATPEGAIRIGLAHGAIQSFAEDGAGEDIIPPGRARQSGLDYLALGDWHGSVVVDPRTRYAGTPEPDRFKHDRPASALVVSIAGPGAVPDVREVPTASFTWATRPLHILGSDDAAAMLAPLLPPGPERRQTLLRIAASGRTSLAARAAFEGAIAEAAPEFAHLDLVASDLSTDCEAADLDAIDRAGALRRAAETLLAESADPTLGAAEREIARGALVRLFSLGRAAAS